MCGVVCVLVYFTKYRVWMSELGCSDRYALPSALRSLCGTALGMDKFVYAAMPIYVFSCYQKSAGGAVAVIISICSSARVGRRNVNSSSSSSTAVLVLGLLL